MTTNHKGAAGLHEIGQRLSDLLRVMEQKFSEADTTSEDANRAGGSTRVFQSQDGKIRAEMGFRMRMGGLAPASRGEDAASRAERRPRPAAPAPTAPAAPAAPAARPAFEIFEEADHILITLDRPALEGASLAFTLEAGVLVARFDGPSPVEERIPLPASVAAHGPVSHAWRNGILCIRLDTAGKEA